MSRATLPPAAVSPRRAPVGLPTFSTTGTAPPLDPVIAERYGGRGGVAPAKHASEPEGPRGAAAAGESAPQTLHNGPAPLALANREPDPPAAPPVLTLR